MKKSIVISASLLSFFAFGYTEEEFNNAVSNVSIQIRLAQTAGQQIQQTILYANQSLDQLYQDAIILQHQYNNDYYNGYETGVANAVGTAKTHLQSINISLDGLMSNAANAQQALANLRYISGNTNQVDMSGVITAINTASSAIQSLLNTSNGYLQNIDSNIGHYFPEFAGGINAAVNAIGSACDELYQIRLLLQDGSSGGGSDSNDDLLDLIGIVTDFYSDFLSYTSDVLDIVDWLNDANGVFKKFYTDATDRMAQPDSMLATDLARMWQYTFQNFTNIVQHPERYLPSAQVDSVLQIDGENLRLSNEGLISAHNLAMNQRQYLCSLAMLEELKGMNATNNLAWITNYLETVQKPYYDLFNQFEYNLKGPFQLMPFVSSTYDNLTNYFAVASDPSKTVYQKMNAEYAFRSSTPYRTNYFARLEMYLQGLNGFFDTDSGWSELKENLDSETMSHHIEDTTNNLVSVVETIGSMSNSLVAVTGAFKDFMDSFDFDMGEYNSGVFTVCPSFSLGSIQIPTLHVDYNDLSFFVTPCRNFFQFLWYTVFAVFSFKFVLIMFRLLVKSISHVVLVISTLFS